MKRILGLALTGVLMVSLLGCSNSETTQDSSDTSNQEVENTQVTDATDATEETDEASEPTEAEVLNLRAIAPEGATTIAMVQMIHDQPNLGENVTVTYESLSTTDLLSSDLMGEKTDFAIAPVNLAANLYNKGVPYTLVSVNTHGNLFMITTLDIATWEDLKGKTVYMIGQGLVPDLIFRYLSSENGVVADEDFEVVYLSGATEIAPSFLSGKAEIIIAPEPVLSVISTKDVPYSVLFDFQKEYESVTGLEGGYPQAGLLVRNTLIEEHPEVVSAFVDAMAASNAWVNEDAETAAQYIVDLDLGIPAPISIKAMPGLNIRFDSMATSKDALEKIFDVIYEASPNALGGSLPDEGFYGYEN